MTAEEMHKEMMEALKRIEERLTPAKPPPVVMVPINPVPPPPMIGAKK